MLDTCLVIPLLEAWSDFLRARGREEGPRAKLVTQLNEGERQGYAAWRVLPAAEACQSVVTSRLGSGSISF